MTGGGGRLRSRAKRAASTLPVWCQRRRSRIGTTAVWLSFADVRRLQRVVRHFLTPACNLLDEIGARLVRRTPYGNSAVSAVAAEAQAKAFRAVRALGFRENEARRALFEATTHVGSGARLELIVRAALERLSAHAWAKAS